MKGIPISFYETQYSGLQFCENLQGGHFLCLIIQCGGHCTWWQGLMSWNKSIVIPAWMEMLEKHKSLTLFTVFFIHISHSLPPHMICCRFALPLGHISLTRPDWQEWSALQQWWITLYQDSRTNKHVLFSSIVINTPTTIVLISLFFSPGYLISSKVLKYFN